MTDWRHGVRKSNHVEASEDVTVPAIQQKSPESPRHSGTPRPRPFPADTTPTAGGYAGTP